MLDVVQKNIMLVFLCWGENCAVRNVCRRDNRLAEEGDLGDFLDERGGRVMLVRFV